MVNLMSQKMGIHEWSYDNAISNDQRYKVPLKDQKIALKNIKVEVELDETESPDRVASEICRTVEKIYVVRSAELSSAVPKE